MKRVLTLAIIIFSFTSLGGRFDARTKQYICSELDDHIPALMQALDQEKMEFKTEDCKKVKDAFTDTTVGEPGHDLKNFNCKKDYGKIREIYNKLIARKALLEEIDTNKLGLIKVRKGKGKRRINQFQKRAIARLEYFHQTFFNQSELDNILQSNTTPDIQQIRRKIKCGTTVTDCKNYLDDDFLEKFLAVLKIGYSCNNRKNSTCKQEAKSEIELLDKRIVEFFQAKGLMNQKITGDISSVGSKFDSSLRTNDEFTEEASAKKLCDTINIEIIQQNSGKNLEDFRDQLYSPLTKIGTLQKTYENLFNCKVTNGTGGCSFEKKHHRKKIKNYVNKSTTLKNLLDSPPNNVKVLRDFLSASLQAQHTLCDADDKGPFKGIVADCGTNSDALKIFITQNQKAVHIIDSFASFNQSENNQQLVYDTLMSFCPKVTNNKVNKICNIKDEVAHKVYQATPGGKESQKQHDIYQAGCEGHPSCRVLRNWNDETLEYDYSIQRGYGMQPMGGGWAGQSALGVAQGLAGYGSYSYFGAPTNHFAGALFQWSWNQNFGNYFGSYKESMMPYWQAQTTYNSYLSQYQEAMSLNAMGIPQQVNWEAIYPAYSGDSFSGISSMHAF